MFKKDDFKPGKVAFNELKEIKGNENIQKIPEDKFWLGEDLLQVEYLYGYGLDAGWYGGTDGKFVIRAFKGNYEDKISEKECKTFSALKKAAGMLHKKIMDRIKKEDTRKCCKNCAFFKFSGMSRQMSGDTAGYCFYWMSQTGARVIVRIDNVCGKFKLIPFSKKENGKTNEAKVHMKLIKKMREEYEKKSKIPERIKLPIEMAK